MFLFWYQVTWMEINYVNQYGTTAFDNTDFYIIEVHRFERPSAVGYFNLGPQIQPDFPLSGKLKAENHL